MSDLQGYTFLCSILSIISKKADKKERLDEHLKTGKAFANSEKDELSRDWAVFAQRAVRINKVSAKDLAIKYSSFAQDQKNYDEFITLYNEIIVIENNKPKKTLTNAFNSIFVNQKGAQPYFFFGIAATISIASELSHADDNFFIGAEESKEILFKAMEILDFKNAECIPETCFDDSNFTLLLLAALYNAMLVVFPYHADHRDRNYENGLAVLNRILDSDLNSKLFAAIRKASESKDIINELWHTQDIACSTAAGNINRGIPFETIYVVPALVSEHGMRLLEKEKNYRIRSYVEGKSGSGKSSLARTIVLASSQRFNFEKTGIQIQIALGINNQKYKAILLDYASLELEELKMYGLFGNALDQMHRNAVQQLKSNQRVLRHYTECKEYIQTYLERKAAEGELILLIDDFSFADEALSTLFLKQLSNLSVLFPNLNIVLFSNRLKPSERRKFSRYSFFQLSGSFSAAKACYKLIGLCDASVLDAILNDKVVSIFVDTPGNMRKYLEQGNEKGIFRLVSEIIDEEIDRKCADEVIPELCKSFLDRLVIEALNRRIAPDEPVIIPGNIITVDFLESTKIDRDEGLAIWGIIQKKHILIERSARVNSFEFCNSLYFDSLIADHFVKILESRNEFECAGFALNVLSKLSCSEFVRIVANVFYRITTVDSYYMKRSIREENLDVFVKAIAGVMFSYDRADELEEFLWVINRILTDMKTSNQFLKRGNYEYREMIYRRIERFKELLEYGLEQTRDISSMY